MTGGYSIYPYFILYNYKTQYAEFIQNHPNPAFLKMQIRNYFKLEKPQAGERETPGHKTHVKSGPADEFKKRVTNRDSL